MGSAFTLAIEHWDSGAMAPVFEEARDDVMYSVLNLTEIEAETRVVADAYMNHYAKPDLMELEFKLDVPGTDYWNHGFVDCVSFEGDTVRLIENKLLNPMFWSKNHVEALKLDEQAMSYAWAGSLLYPGKKIIVEYRVTKKTKLRKKVGDSLSEYIQRVSADYSSRPDHYFIAVPLEYSDDDIESIEENIIATTRDMLSGTGGLDVWNSRSCTDFGGCEFLKLCALGDSSGYYVEEDNDETVGV